MKFKLKLILCILVLVFTLVGCDSLSETQKGMGAISQDSTLLSYSKSVSADTLSILNGAGTINIIPNDTDELLVECLVAYDGKSDADFKAKTKAITLTPHIENGIVYLEVMAEGELNYWEWLEKNIDVDHIKVNYNIKLPSNITNVRAVNAVGELYVKDLSTSLTLETYVGNIECNNLRILKHSNIYVSTGNITFLASSISEASTIFNGVEVGNITCELPQNAKYTIDNSQVPETAFTVDRKLLFDSKTIANYREMLTAANNTQNDGVDTIVGNKSGFGRVKVK